MLQLRRPELHAAFALQPVPVCLPLSSLPARLPLVCLLLCFALAKPLPAQNPAAPAPVPPGSSAAPPAPLPQLPALLPGIEPDENDDGLLSVHGLPATQTTRLLDGVDTTQRFLSVPAGSASDPAPDPEGDSDSAELSTGPANGLARGRHAGAPYTFSQTAVREIQSTPDAFSSETHAGAGVLLTESRSGTSALHGSAFFILRSSAFAAANPLAVATTYHNGIVSTGIVKPHDLRLNFGATLGGPVPHARDLTFFYAFDAQRRGFPAISSPADPAFYNLTAIQSALLANRGLSHAQVNAALDFLSSLTGSTPRRADQTIDFARLEWQRHPRFTLGLAYNGVRWNSPAGLIDAPVVARARDSIGTSTGSLDQLLLRVTSSFTAHLVNRGRVEYMHDLQYESPQANLAQEPAIGPGGVAPEVNIGPNGILLGTPASLSQQAFPDESRITLSDTLALTRAHHLVQLGGSFAYTHDRTATLPNAAGTFLYDSGASNGRAGGLVDFLTDETFNVNTIPNGACPSISAATHDFCFRSFTQSFGEQQVSFSTQDWAAFVEETWHPQRARSRRASGLTLQAGLRYEYTLLPVPQHPNAALDAVFGARGATSVFPEDRNNLGPRTSLSWEPFGPGRGLLRAGFGLFFGRLPGATIQSALADTGQSTSTTRIRITPATVTSCPQVPAQGFGYPCDFLAQPTGVVASTTSAMLFDRRFRLPAIEHGSLTVERSLPRETTVTLGYSFNLDRQLATSTDLNIAPSTQTAEFQLQGGTGAVGVRNGETFLLPLYTARLTPAFGPVTDVLSNANGTYNALNATVASRPLRTLELRGNYTWSKTLDDGPNLSAIPRTNAQLDPFTDGYDKGLSSLHYPWSLCAVASWTPKLESPHARLRRLANGWEVTLSLTARAGRPYTLDLSGGEYLPGGHESINGSGGALYLPTVGRNTLRLPATIKTDLALGRAFQAGAHVRLRASAEAFNLFNHQVISSVAQRAYLIGTPLDGITPLVFQDAATVASEGLNTQPFGTPTAAGTSLSRERQIQLSLHLEF